MSRVTISLSMSEQSQCEQ